jgi:hypothetical protein
MLKFFQQYMTKLKTKLKTAISRNQFMTSPNMKYQEEMYTPPHPSTL